MTYKIDKDIPHSQSMSARLTETAEMLEVGDSFFIPCENENAVVKKQQLVLNYNQRKGMKSGKRLSTHATTENGVLGLRVWRKE